MPVFSPPRELSSPFGEPRVPVRVLVIIDQYGWAFDRNALDLAEYLRPLGFEIARWAVSEAQLGEAPPDPATYDVVYNVYHRAPVSHWLPWEKAVGSLRGQFFSPTGRDRCAGPMERALVNRYRAFHVVTAGVFADLQPWCPHLWYLTNPVDHRRFEGCAPLTDRLVASWSGKSTHDSAGWGVDVKRLCRIRQVCRAAEVELVTADAAQSRLPLEAMPGFYCRGNLTLCASLYEGASNSVMEAMAVGHAVVATEVGNHRELRDAQLLDYGETGMVLVDGTESAFVAELERLKRDLGRVRAMGEINRRSIRDRWSWEVWATRYAAFLREGMRPPPPENPAC